MACTAAQVTTLTHSHDLQHCWVQKHWMIPLGLEKNIHGMILKARVARHLSPGLHLYPRCPCILDVPFTLKCVVVWILAYSRSSTIYISRPIIHPPLSVLVHSIIDIALLVICSQDLHFCN